MVCSLSSYQLGFQYPGQLKPLFQDLHFQIDSQSRIGLIGRNGSGKSTLIRLLVGSLAPTWGRLERHPELRLGYLPQNPGSVLLRQRPTASVADFLWHAKPRLLQLRKQINAGECFPLEILTEFEVLGGYQFEWQAERELSKVGLAADVLARHLSNLSGGERARVGLAFLALQQPNFLLLDEPGNDLDAEMLEWLSDFLHDSTLPYLLISHDRRLLDDATDSIWELDGTLTIRQGNYQTYRQQRQQEREHQASVYAQQQKQSQRLQAAVQERKQRAERIESFKAKRSVKNNGGICKRDDGSIKAVRTGHLMRSAMAVEQRLEQLQAKSTRPIADDRLPPLFFSRRLRTGTQLLSVSDLSYQIAERLLFAGLRFELVLGQRLAITGRNGSGKSTLIRLLLSANPQQNSAVTGEHQGKIHWGSQVRIGYFSQNVQNLPLDRSPLDWVQASVPEQDRQQQRTRAHTLLACLGLKLPFIQPLGSFSRGEQTKVALAALLAAEPDVLLLDEPTNHLELAARERLQAALVDYQGSLILVSHDRQFRTDLCESELSLGTDC